ncbi:MAG: hypothetical protein O2924_00655 [Chloroflexi bacterium]|nr:hypothetical protein [Chloroflexota bacterium]
MIDGGIEIDLDEVVQNIEEAEIVSLFFPTLRRALLVDTRTNEHAGTFVKVVPMAQSGADRLRSVRKLRPQFARPESITIIPWDAHVDSLVALGVWGPLIARLDCPDIAEACLDTLRLIEHAEHRAAILGDEYETLWSRGDL